MVTSRLRLSGRSLLPADKLIFDRRYECSTSSPGRSRLLVDDSVSQKLLAPRDYSAIVFQTSRSRMLCERELGRSHTRLSLTASAFIFSNASSMGNEFSIKCIGASRSFPLPFLFSLCAPGNMDLPSLF